MEQADYLAVLKQTSNDIQNFADEVYSKPGNIEDINPYPLLNSIDQSTKRILDFEEYSSKKISLDPHLTQELYDRIKLAVQNLSYKIKNVEHEKRRTDALVMAINGLLQFEAALRNLTNRFDKEDAKIKRKEPPSPIADK